VLNNDLNTSVACGSSCIVFGFLSLLLDVAALQVDALLTAGVDDFAEVTRSAPSLPSAHQNVIHGRDEKCQ